MSYPASASSLRNPVAATPEAIAEGRRHFDHDCAVCHGKDGSGRTEIAHGLYPKVPNLRHEADLTDGQLFYIIRNGVRFTGMPGWDDPDESLWKLVLLIRDLPKEPMEPATAQPPAAGSGESR